MENLNKKAGRELISTSKETITFQPKSKMEHRFKAITNRSEGRFDFSEVELREELLQVASSSDFRETTRETARDIIEDHTGAIWFSGFDFTDPAFHK